MNFAAVVLVLTVASTAQVVSGLGFRAAGQNILDSAGRVFIMRGINYAHTWYKQDAAVSIPAIAATGANVIRIVLSNGHVYQKDDAATVQYLLNLCAQHKLVAILEVHDATGTNLYSNLALATDYWISLAPVLRGTEAHVIINVANEWMGKYGQAQAWAIAYRSVIPFLRKAGLNHLLVVDAPGWGQDADAIAQQGLYVWKGDPLRNLAFSIHMYEVAAADPPTVARNIDNSLAIGLPLIIGEFSNYQNGKPVAYEALLRACNFREVGWLAWSWWGNNAATKNMDLATSPRGGLTTLGDEIVNSPLGIRSTAVKATW